ncbi:hypothetical protein Aaci_1524 [Alicyclobacillus acidocaldarius subsp. acidocaldarius DSM 446]|uniref:Uncharacterized protein n=1 Tax=Alicyclobacillus acidocaldarius subsp. acidocaldarius (strain ATCC 27009 / DSM 446 / BCRC 14685 / JCM 5260 / KCTC 1825 / NBRC 15652 / NCIMB 11725 / NRRL B-14509 / 104-IA) TaxID=521098 RepID=C8WWS2_ALIAD|nr:hypothetical protein Aaci_1524 [Alicyclobacillus acidocaldarius subsp. acidocaldarius DSM 446]
MNTFYIFLGVLSGLFLIFSLVVARKKPVKRDFANSFFFTLVTFFIAVHPTQLFTLSILLVVLTLYNVYIILKR